MHNFTLSVIILCAIFINRGKSACAQGGTCSGNNVDCSADCSCYRADTLTAVYSVSCGYYSCQGVNVTHLHFKDSKSSN